MLKKNRIIILLAMLILILNFFTSESNLNSQTILTYEQLFPEKTGIVACEEGTFSPAIPRAGTRPPEVILPNRERVEPVPMPDQVKGVYATGWAAGSSFLFSRLIDFMEQTEINSLVIDIKDDSGLVSYKSVLPKVNELESWNLKIQDPTKLLRVLQKRQVYPIARIVVFKDPFLAEKRPDLAIKDNNGEMWRDYRGLAWVDPHNKEVWEYNIEIAKEAVNLGFPEIQFDYVRFASDGDLSNCVYPFSDGTSKEDVIKEFLLYAKEELEPLGAVVSADIFGLACSAKDDLFIGQKLEKIAEAVPIISPMVYPSHYANGSYGLSVPDLFPYETVLQSMKDAKARLEGYPVKLRPWLQDFSLGSKYGNQQINAQIQAVLDAGVEDWIFWNPSCRYDVAKYLIKDKKIIEKNQLATKTDEDEQPVLIAKEDGVINLHKDNEEEELREDIIQNEQSVPCQVETEKNTEVESGEESEEDIYFNKREEQMIPKKNSGARDE
jgi:hypothetical protein